MKRNYYKGISLVKYCQQNGIKYKAVLTRMREKAMSVEEAVETLNNDRWIIKCEDGTPLIKKCKDLKEYLRLYRKMRYKGMTYEEAKVAKPSYGKCKHFKDGIPMKHTCKDEREYQKIMARLHRGVPYDLAVNGTRRKIYEWRKGIK